MRQIPLLRSSELWIDDFWAPAWPVGSPRLHLQAPDKAWFHACDTRNILKQLKAHVLRPISSAFNVDSS